MSGQAPNVSIIVPFFNNSREEVNRCLNAVLSQDLPDDLFVEVIVVDNGSSAEAGTLAALRAHRVRVVECSTPGPAAARNAGIAAARAPIVAFTDSDCVPESDWLRVLVGAFANPSVAISGGPIRALRTDIGVARFAEEYKVLDQLSFFKSAPGLPPFFATANAAFRRDAVLAAGGFDETLRMSEDADLCWRILDAGHDIVYCKNAEVRHAHRTTFRGLHRWGLDYGYYTAVIAARHRHRFRGRRLIVWPYYRTMAAFPLVWLWALLFGGSAYARMRPLYEAIWCSGYMLGRWRGSLKHRVLVL